MMMDDVYILKPLVEMPIYRGRKIGETNLGQNAEMFRKITKKLGVRTSWSYEFHIPFLVEREKIQYLFKVIEEEKPTDFSDVYWRSLYGNFYRLRGKTETDVKFWDEPVIRPEQQFLSSANGYFKKHCRPIVQKLFPEPSIYEK